MSPFPLLLEAAIEDDLEPILEVERRSFSHPWTARGFRAAMEDPSRGRLVLLRTPGPPTRGVIVGYSAFEVVLDELHIHTLAVHPLHRGLGLGRRLLSRVLDLGVRRGARSALLEVRPSNWAALGLYRAFGFQTVGVRHDYYEHPREDALMLEKSDLREDGP